MRYKFEINNIYKSFFISFFFFIIICIFWDKIKLPYDNSNLIFGESYQNKTNPINDTIRFLFTIFLPFITYLLCIFFFYKKNLYSLDFKKKNFFLLPEQNLKNKKTSNIKLLIVFYLYLIIEFLLIDFNHFIFLEFYHDGGYLVSPKNFLTHKELSSTFYDRGFFTYNIGLITYYFFGYYTPATIALTKLILILLIKFLLLRIINKIVLFLNFSPNVKSLFFFIVALAVINLPNYYDSYDYFSERMFPFLLLLLLSISSFTDLKFFRLKFFTIGTFSLFCILWSWDIGIYVNLFLLIISAILIVQKNKSALYYLFLGIFFSWLIFFLIIPLDDLSNFFTDLTEYVFNANYLMGIDYKKPFTLGSTRWTKAILTFFISGILLINLNLFKQYKLNYSLKISLNLIFISSLIVFNSALVRSDSIHLRYSSGLSTVLFIILLSLFIFLKIDSLKLIKKKFIKIFQRTSCFPSLNTRKYFLLLIFFGFIFINKNFILDNFLKIKNYKNNLNSFLKTKDIEFLKKEHIQNINGTFKYSDILLLYKEISEDDTCVQVLTADVSFPYFLNKPTCTKFYNTVGIITQNLEKKFIEELSKSLPNIILFDSPIKHLPTVKDQKNLRTLSKFISNNYQFYKDFKGFIFYKKKI